MKKIALLPGGFKPPHAGHYNMAKWLATNTDADSVVIRVGSKEREGITREISLALWDLYIKDDENIIVKASIANSPVRDVYDFIEQEAPEGSTVYLGMGEKDINDKRFANIGKFAEPRNIKFKTVLVPPQAGGISGTQMREFINKGDKINFQKFIPDHVNKDQAWNIVTNLEEDLYNPNDHYRDFAKSSEWKAGYSKEDDIEPGYKYRRGGMYSGGGMGFGGMYETRGGEQELHIYDFDETIARVETAIPYTVKSPDGKIIEKGETTSVNFEEKQNKLENDYDKGVTIDFDFGAFEKQIENAIINEPVYNKLLNSLKSSNVKTTVLTARSIGHPVTRYLKSIGLEVYVVPLGLQVDGKVTGQDKANWIDKRIKKTTKRVYFIDDSKNNRIAVNLLKDKHPNINFKIENPPKIKEKEVDEMMMGMMSPSEKRKHDKNMKRLSKDMSRMKGNNYGGGGYKVPNYVKGTLTRKLHKEMKETKLFSKEWWGDILNEVLLQEGGAAGHMAHPFDLPNVTSGKDLLDIFEKSSNSLNKNPGAVKIDGVNASIRLVDIDGKKQFALDRGSKMALDIKGVTKSDLEDRFKTKDGTPHGFIKTGGEVLDMFNEALPSLKDDLIKLGAWNNPNILFNMEYVSGKTNVQEYGSNFIAIHGLNEIKMVDEPSKKTGKMLSRRKSKEITYSKDDLQSLLDNLKPIAKKRGFEVYGSVPTEMKKKPNFSSALSTNYTIKTNEGDKTQSLNNWLNELDNIPKEDFIFMNGKKTGAVAKLVYMTLLKGGNIDELFEKEEDKQKAVKGWTTYLATEKLGDEVLKVLDSPMGTADNHEGVVIRDKDIANVPFKITGKFILGGLQTGFRQ